MKIEETIIRGLMSDEEFARRVTPHIETNFFQDRAEAMVVGEITEFFTKFATLPSKEILRIQLGQKTGISEDVYSNALTLIDKIETGDQNRDWLLEQTEKFCKDRSVYNAIVDSLKIIEGTDKNRSPDAIPSILQSALSISFSSAVGHSYIEDAAARYDFYNNVESRIEFDIELLNKITHGGLPNKSLTILLSVSGGGKSLVMTHMAAANLRKGKNVLYITMEMAEERIAERIDANLLNVDVDKIKSIGKDAFLTKIDNIASKSHGKLIIKEYPTGAAHSGHFRGLLEELKIKKNFIPDIIYVDYLGICASARVRMSGSINSYQYLKNVAEELRGLAVEFNVPVVSAGQVNRNAYGSSDMELAEIADSAAIIHTADLILGIIRTDELDELDQVMLKNLKNRFGDPSRYKKFVVGLNRARMKLYDLEPSAQLALAKEATFTPGDPRANTKQERTTSEPTKLAPKGFGGSDFELPTRSIDTSDFGF